MKKVETRFKDKPLIEIARSFKRDTKQNFNCIKIIIIICFSLKSRSSKRASKQSKKWRIFTPLTDPSSVLSIKPFCTSMIKCWKALNQKSSVSTMLMQEWTNKCPQLKSKTEDLIDKYILQIGSKIFPYYKTKHYETSCLLWMFVWRRITKSIMISAFNPYKQIFYMLETSFINICLQSICVFRESCLSSTHMFFKGCRE